MKFLRMIPIIFIFFGIYPYSNLSYAESKNPKQYKIFSSTNKKLSISDVKDYLAKEFKHFNSQIIDLDEKLSISNEQNNFEGENLRRRQYTFGISLEDLELILHPMAEEAKEATGSMGDDTPLAVLSDRYRPLYHFFRQNFSPPCIKNYVKTRGKKG